MHNSTILLEIFIAAFTGIPAILFCGLVAWKYRNDKYETRLRSLALAMCIFMTVFLIIFEIIWILQYNGVKI